MAGTKTGQFKEIISPYLKKLIEDNIEKYGDNSSEVEALKKQYYIDPREKNIKNSDNERHYQSELKIDFEGKKLVGVERLYKRTILLEPTTVCAAHCRWCLRGQYPTQTMKHEEITHATKYIGNQSEINEILLTGGDPLMSLPLLAFTLSELTSNSPNIKRVRIGTRVPVQDPSRINDKMMDIFTRYPNMKFEIGLNICHSAELTKDSLNSLEKFKKAGIVLYNQHPLLKDVNDNIDDLVSLYDKLRSADVESHYIFHAIPMRGAAHHRTKLKKGLDLVEELCSGGKFSGRSKPKYAVLSDIGKIVLYEGCIIDRNEEENTILLKSGFEYEERIKWVPNWILPESASVDTNGKMNVWYKDAD